MEVLLLNKCYRVVTIETLFMRLSVHNHKFEFDFIYKSCILGISDRAYFFYKKKIISSGLAALRIKILN